MPYIPHTEEDQKRMLEAIGATSTDALFDEIPAHLKYEGFKNMPEGLSEMAMLKKAKALSCSNQNGICFAGAGSYEHHIPAAVWDITSRGEFLTAYTPYQAEASQGTLQLLYEFQTMIAELTGMEVANASLYDGATALAEAALMAVRINKTSKSKRILVAGSIHPYYRQTLDTIVRNQHIEVVTLDYDLATGTSCLKQLETFSKEDITALIIAQPNFFGCLEKVDEMTDWARDNNIISIASVNPISLALLKPPGEWGRGGADIACGEGQPLGIPMASGGPYFGFFSTKLEFVRQMPGRLIGRTVDKDNKPGFTLTLQAREQHIRRGKATSNICTNQGLMVTAATIHMSILGVEGLRQAAGKCHHNSHALAEKLTQIQGITVLFSAPFFHEVVLKFNKPVAPIQVKLMAAGINGGYPLQEHDSRLKNTVLVCATECRTEEEIEHYYQTLSSLMQNEK